MKQPGAGVSIRRSLVVAGIMLSMLHLAGAPLHAFGFGFYGSAGLGPTPLTIKGSEKHRDNGVGFGLLLDTAVARNEVVNYRAHIGYENLVNNGSVFFSRYGMHRAYFSNTFGFGVVRRKSVRFWMGPQLSFSAVYKDLNVPYRFQIVIPRNTLYYKSYRYNFLVPMIGFGSVFGVNVNIGDHFTFGFEAGFHTSMGVGPYKHSVNNLYVFNAGTPGATLLPVRESTSRDYEYFKFEISARVSMIFRVGDVYQAEAPDNGRDKKQSEDDRLGGQLDQDQAEGGYKK